MILIDLFSRVLNMSLAAGIIILLVLAVRFLLRKTPKIFSYLLWAAVLFRLLCPVAPESRVSVLGLLQTADEYHNPKIVYYTTETVTVGDEYIGESGVALYTSKKIPHDIPREPVPVVQIIWLAGTAGMLLYGLAGALRLKKRLKSAVWQRDNVFLTDCVGTPFVMGIWHPKIYLPRGITEDEKYYVLAHERHHIERHDHIVKLLAYLALSIHWFNPLVWVAFYLAEKDMEMSCDEAVMEVLGASVRADYALSLLCYTGYRRMARGTPLSFGESCAKSRVKNLARWKRAGRLTEIIAGMLCILMLLTCVTDPAAAEELVIPEETEEQTVNAGTLEETRVVLYQQSKAVGERLEETRAHLGTWYMEGYYDVTLEVSEIYDPYTKSYAMHLKFSEYAPKLSVTIPYEKHWDRRMSKYGIDLLGDMIQVSSRISGRSVTFVREKGDSSILEDYSHLIAFGSWESTDGSGSYISFQKRVSESCDKYYDIQIRKKEGAKTIWRKDTEWDWFSAPVGITVEKNGRFLKTKLLGVEIATLEKPVAFNAYGPSQLLG